MFKNINVLQNTECCLTKISKTIIIFAALNSKKSLKVIRNIDVYRVFGL